MTFDPRTAIVTGADSGIGRAIAVELDKAGVDVGVTWHEDSDGAQKTAAEVREYGRRAEVARLDTTDIPACGDVIDALADRLGGVDVFVNDAGTGDNAPFLELTLDADQAARPCARDRSGGRHSRLCSVELCQRRLLARRRWNAVDGSAGRLPHHQ